MQDYFYALADELTERAVADADARAAPPSPDAAASPPPVPEDAAPSASDEPPSPVPTIWSRLGPVFAENLLFALGGFLLVAGAVYFVTTAWTTMGSSAATTSFPS